MQVAAAFAGIAQAPHEAPQLAVLVLLRQTPAQLWNPALHAKPQVPAVHVAVAFAGAVHDVAHVPQCPGSVLMLTSQPFEDTVSQSRYPTEQL